MLPRQILLDALKRHFGFDKFKGNQEAIISNLLDGHDTFVLMPTGGGKSLCYQLPALLSDGTAVIVSPLIALMKNQVDAMRNFSESDSIAHFLNSSLNRAAIDTVKHDIISGETKMLYVAPESLTKEDNIEFLKSVNVSFYAIDEAHCISEWGHDFRPEYRRIRPIINEIGSRPVIALTATATPKVQHDIQKNLGMTDVAVFKSSFNRPNLYYEVRPKTKTIDRDIIKFVKQNAGKSGIIYCLSRKKVEELAELLTVNDIRALPYHAGLDSATRSDNQDAFLLEKIDVIVATIAFGMGIDKPDVRFVIHYDMPKSLEGYYQETGRAGRDGGEGMCIAYYSYKDLQKMEKFMQGKPVAEQEIGRQLLVETAAYAESSVCRRRTLLHYFGETYESEKCGHCDNCCNTRQEIDATDELLNALETVAELKEKFKADHIIDILLGKNTNEIKAYRHDLIETYGSCRNRDYRFLNAVMRQASLCGYLSRDIENYGLVRMTDEGRKFLADPKRFSIFEDIEFVDDDENATTTAADPQLYAILLSLRREIASRQNLPPYVIFQEPALETMATTYPITLEELQNISGVGAGKAKRFGQQFVDLIKKYVDENEIERPEDLRVRSIANKGNVKYQIIPAIDRKVDLVELARILNLTFEQLIDKIESIVKAGTKINIAYYLDTLMDSDDQNELFEFFTQCQSDDIGEAYAEFCPDYSENEIRLVRIRFMSEMGN